MGGEEESVEVDDVGSVVVVDGVEDGDGEADVGRGFLEAMTCEMVSSSLCCSRYSSMGELESMVMIRVLRPWAK